MNAAEIVKGERGVPEGLNGNALHPPGDATCSTGRAKFTIPTEALEGRKPEGDHAMILTMTGAEFARHVLEEFDLSEAQQATLQLAAQALDRARDAQAELESRGLIVEGLHGPRPNPAVIIKRDAVAEYARLVKALGLHVNRVDAPDRPEFSAGLLD